jgi:hypothetical protein
MVFTVWFSHRTSTPFHAPVFSWVLELALESPFIMNCTAAILQGITVHAVPTIPLGVDQSSNFNQNVSFRRDQGISIRSIHLETEGNKNAFLIVTNLKKLMEMTDTTLLGRIVLVASPQTLFDQKLSWFKLLLELSEKRLV